MNTNSKPSSPSVVVGVDITEQSENAASWAAREAADRGTTLTVVHALDLPQDANRQFDPLGLLERRRADGATLLGRAVEQYPEVPITFEAEYGDPATVLHKAARDARLLVVGSHRRHDGLTPRLGSTVRELLAHPGTPVAVVPIQ